MRDLTSGMLTAIQAKTLSPIYLMRAAFNSGEIRLWTGYGDLVWDDFTYLGAGTLIEVSAIRETTGGEIVGAEWTLSGVSPDTLNLALEEHYQNRPVEMWFGCLDDSGQLIPDPVLVFSGLMDVMRVDDDPEEPRISLTAETRLIGSLKSRALRYTSADQKALYPGDKGFDFVEEIQDKNIVWGR